MSSNTQPFSVCDSLIPVEHFIFVVISLNLPDQTGDVVLGHHPWTAVVHVLGVVWQHCVAMAQLGVGARQAGLVLGVLAVEDLAGGRAGDFSGIVVAPGLACVRERVKSLGRFACVHRRLNPTLSHPLFPGFGLQPTGDRNIDDAVGRHDC